MHQHQHQKSAARFAGIHLSGPNAGKTTLIILSAAGPEAGPLRIEQVYEKIGALGSLFSDERLYDLLTKQTHLAEVFVDSPLSLPPCVACQRPVCPGVVACDDVAVAYMLAVSSRRRRKGARRGRPINPQSQRLWDVLRLEAPTEVVSEPSYSANLAPLVARGLTLQRRLNAASTPLLLKETSTALALLEARAGLSLKAPGAIDYRHFERGSDNRRHILDRLVASSWLRPPPDAGDELWAYTAAVESVEVFQALIAAWVAALHHWRLTIPRPEDFLQGEGWVYLPELAHPSRVKTPEFS